MWVSVPSRPTREVLPGSCVSTSSFVSSLVTASLRYEDGKTLKGMGTRASKSRLTGGSAFLLECLSNRYEEQFERKTRKNFLAPLREEGWGFKEIGVG